MLKINDQNEIEYDTEEELLEFLQALIIETEKAEQLGDYYFSNICDSLVDIPPIQLSCGKKRYHKIVNPTIQKEEYVLQPSSNINIIMDEGVGISQII